MITTSTSTIPVNMPTPTAISTMRLISPLSPGRPPPRGGS
jgi:hypothetical protein